MRTVHRRLRDFFYTTFCLSTLAKSAMLSSGGIFRISKFDHGPKPSPGVVPRGS